MEMTINSYWKIFFHEVKRYHYGKLIGIREFLERLALDLCNNTFSNDTRNAENNIPLLDEVDDRKTVTNLCEINFSSSNLLH